MRGTTTETHGFGLESPGAVHKRSVLINCRTYMYKDHEGAVLTIIYSFSQKHSDLFQGLVPYSCTGFHTDCKIVVHLNVHVYLGHIFSLHSCHKHICDFFR